MRLEKIDLPEKCREKIEALCNELLLDKRFGAADILNITSAVYITCISNIARFSTIPRADILLTMEALMIETKNEIAKGGEDAEDFISTQEDGPLKDLLSKKLEEGGD